MILPVTFDRPQCPSIAKLLGKTSMDEAWDHALMIGRNADIFPVVPPRPSQAATLLGMSQFISYESWVPDRIKLTVRSLDVIPIPGDRGGPRDLVDHVTQKVDVNAAFLPKSGAIDGRIYQGGEAPWFWVATGTQETSSEYYGTRETVAYEVEVYPMALPAITIDRQPVRWDGIHWIIPSFPPGPFSQSYDVKLSLTPPIRLR